MNTKQKVIFTGLLSLILLISMTLAASANTAVTGAAFTTVNESVDGTGHCANGNPNVNCNIYDGKQFVWLNGGPSAAYVGDGDYFFAVLVPGGQPNPNDGGAKNLSDDFDAYTNRSFSVSSGAVSYSGSHDFDSNKIRLMPYADTSNPGGVYIMAICSLGSGYPVTPSKCKYDAFKVKQNEEPAIPPTITKDANGADDNTYSWTIDKGADRTLVKTASGIATFTYTVTVSHDGGTISDVKVTGTISVFNWNDDGQGGVVPLDINGVTDELSDGPICDVTNGGPQTLSVLQTDFPYVCDLGDTLPSDPIMNTATVTWLDQTLSNGKVLSAGSDDWTVLVSFDENAIDECVDVTDSYAGTLGTVCVGDANPTTFTYSRTIAVMPDCHDYDNTATFTTNDTGATGSASETVTVCGPVKTGALTMGFWQNKNGQSIIKNGGAVAGVCKSGTWLRQYAPFQDLSATATCAQVATYVTNVIKAANASGAAMNAMLKGQMLATSLDVYFSDPALGGNKINAPAPIGGVAIDLTKICKNIATCTIYENVSSAFGGASSLNVSQMLAYAASKSNAGGSVWYAQIKATQGLAKDAFDAINNQVAFAP